ncbi:MAG: twin-arginine translocation signal domain-containing protein, partial [Bacteroidota bacterium]
MSSRREFLKHSLLAGAVLALTHDDLFPDTPTLMVNDMQFRFYPYTLELKHVFTVAVSSRSTTAVMMVEVEKDGIIGYGEASMPPYLGESHDTAKAFLSNVDLKKYNDPFTLEDILDDIDQIAPGNHAAKAAVDIALHDWVGKKLGFAWHQAWGLNPAKTPVTSFTIGIDKDKEVIRQ